MEGLLAFWEKLQGVLTSQRFITTVAGLVFLTVTLVGIILPLFRPDFSGLDIPPQDEIAAAIGAWIAQAVIAVSFLLGIVKAVTDLAKSFKERPPTLFDPQIVRRAALRLPTQSHPSPADNSGLQVMARPGYPFEQPPAG